jgi:hypothetical protein
MAFHSFLCAVTSLLWWKTAIKALWPGTEISCLPFYSNSSFQFRAGINGMRMNVTSSSMQFTHVYSF